MSTIIFQFALIVAWVSIKVDTVTVPEDRFCCDNLRIIQHGFRPTNCLTTTECEEREDRRNEILRLYGCADPTVLPTSIKFPTATVSTDRLDGWFPFTSRTGSAWSWFVRLENDSSPVIDTVAGSYSTQFNKDTNSFLHGSPIGPTFELDGYNIYEVPTYVELFQERCRTYDRQTVGYQNIPGSRIYEVLDVTVYSDCKYIVHFSFARDPFKVTRPYFNERDEQEAREQLENPPTTSYFDPVTTSDSTRGYFAFPYFFILRMVCQDEGYYSEEFYDTAFSGLSPAATLLYFPYTTRAHYENPVSVSVSAVLINLEQDEARIMVPDPDVEWDTKLQQRQFFSLNDPTKKICYLNLCQPAYAFPQPFLQIPILRLRVPDDRNVGEYVANLYVNPFHTRTSSGEGEIYVGKQFETKPVSGPDRNVTTVHPRYFFPKVRYTEVDTDLDPKNLHVCTISEAQKQSYEIDVPASFHLQGREFVLDWLVSEMEETKKATPLTADDFFTPQFTFGTAPVVAIAGFYQPTLVLLGSNRDVESKILNLLTNLNQLGDPDMEYFSLIEWDFNPRNDPETNIFVANGTCLTADPYLKLDTRPDSQPVLQKPIYSQRQKDELRRYSPGRRSYIPTNYDIQSRRAIFEIINLEDRILLKTTGGVVALYGNSNATKGVDKVLKAPLNEKVPRCFKVIKSLSVALGDYDPIVGVTYDYVEPDPTGGTQGKKHAQEIWYGRYTTAGSPIQWTDLGSKEYQDTLTPPVHIDPAITVEEISTNISEAAKICRTAYYRYVLPLFPNEQNRTAFRWTKEPDHHNCIILDATPKPSMPNVVQLLLEMTFTFYKELDCNPDSPGFVGECQPLQTSKCIRYHYCVDLVSRGGDNRPHVNSTGPCTFISNIDCPQIPCYTQPDLLCSTTCNCPSCAVVTDCPSDRCHPSCQLCPLIPYFPRRCNCPELLAGVPICNATEALTQCTPCPTNATDCFNSTFGPCKPGETVFCPPPNVFLNRTGPYCPTCMQDFNASLEGDYEYPVKQRISSSNGSEPYPSDLALCQAMIANNNSDDYCKFAVQDIKLYVIAEHEVGKPDVHGNAWDIVAVYPKRSCVNPHFERILNIRTMDESYFGDPRLPMEQRISCFERFIIRPGFDLLMFRMTYTRHINNHLFIYGPRLYHSLDSGNTLVVMRDFPKFPDIFNPLDYDLIKTMNQHVITVLAFSSGASYAFLTSKRELWIGTTGSIRQARLRPNSGWSMARLRLFKNRDGYDEGIPFTVLYDAYDNLFELVALRDPGGHIDRIVKRSVDTQLILRNNYFVEGIHEYVNRQLMTAYRTGANEDFSNTTVTQPIEPGSTLFVHFDIQDLSLRCPFSQIRVVQNYSLTLDRLQRFHFNPPLQHLQLGIDHKIASLMAFSVSAFRILYESYLQKGNEEIYSNVRRDPVEIWRVAKTEEAYIGYVRYLRKEPRQSGIVVDPREATMRVPFQYNIPEGNRFLEKMWLNYNQTINMEIQFYIKNAQLLTKTDFLKQKLSDIQINVDNGNGAIIRLNTERQLVPKTASVKFIAHISLFESDLLTPSFPGYGLVTVPLTFHLVGGFGRCFKLDHWGQVGESLTTLVVAGCPPATGLLFDWNSTLHSLKFRNTIQKYGNAEDCGHGEIVCFSSKEDITFHFDVLDLSNQLYVPFAGKFKLRVIGGGRSRDTIRIYNQDQVDAYNIPGKSDISLIWTLAPETNDTVVIEKDPETQENVLQAGLTQIKFSCNTLSPCARIAPRLDLQAEFYLLVRISNRGVDSDTLCIHEREFVILLYGFTPSPEVLIILTTVGCLFLLSVMYIFYICCRRHRRVWRANKLRFTGWWQIVLDTFPKAIKEGKDSSEAHRRRDSIILSLQGHLGFPEVVAKSKDPEESSEFDVLRSRESSDKVSSHSGESEGSETSLPRVRARKKGATWTDMVYEQIISQRLLAIVKRNRRMREYVLQPPAPPVPADDVQLPTQVESIRSLPLELVKDKEGKKNV